jgi:hypothetical protein
MQVIFAMFRSLSTLRQILLLSNSLRNGLVNPSIKVLLLPAQNWARHKFIFVALMY